MIRTYNQVIQFINDYGDIVSPRDLQTMEIIGAKISCQAGTIVNRKNMNKKLGYLEALMLIGGMFDLDLIAQVAPNANLKLYQKQSDYGLRVRNQVPLIIEELQSDPLSRRAIIQFNADLHLGTDNVACTTGAQFLLRSNCFYARFNMRSWDAVFGLPLDLMMFGMLSLAIDRCIPGSRMLPNVTVVAGSLHYYLDKQKFALASDTNNRFQFDDSWPTTWKEIRDYAAYLAVHHSEWDIVPTGIFETEGFLLRTDL